MQILNNNVYIDIYEYIIYMYKIIWGLKTDIAL